MARPKLYGYVVLMAGTLLALPGCGGDEGGCVPNEQRACACGGGFSGTQVCSATGDSFSVCSCGTDGGPIGCTHASQCDDDNECTTDSCDGEVCQFTPSGGSCDDGDECTTGDQCSAGVCEGNGACSSLECPADALEDYLTGTTVCLSEEEVRAALPANVRGYVYCASVAPCANGCPITLTASVSTNFTPATTFGELAQLDGEVTITSFSFSFSSAPSSNGCIYTGTMSGGTATLDIGHTIPDVECSAPSAVPAIDVSIEDMAYSTSTIPRPGGDTTQGVCNNDLDFLRSYDSDWSSYHEDIVNAWAAYGRPSCRPCTDGCAGDLRCEILPPPPPAP